MPAGSETQIRHVGVNDIISLKTLYKLTLKLMQQSQVYWSANVNKLFTVDSTADFAFQTLWPQPLAGGVADSMKTRYPTSVTTTIFLTLDQIVSPTNTVGRRSQKN